MIGILLIEYHETKVSSIANQLSWDSRKVRAGEGLQIAVYRGAKRTAKGAFCKKPLWTPQKPSKRKSLFPNAFSKFLEFQEPFAKGSWWGAGVKPLPYKPKFAPKKERSQP
jgi:hypothetical protein